MIGNELRNARPSVNRSESPLVKSTGVAKNTELHQAVAEGDISRLRTLVVIQSGLVSKGNRFGDTPLHMAALEANVKAMKILIEAGADCKAENVRGESPLEMVPYTDDAGPAIQLLIRN